MNEGERGPHTRFAAELTAYQLGLQSVQATAEFTATDGDLPLANMRDKWTSALKTKTENLWRP